MFSGWVNIMDENMGNKNAYFVDMLSIVAYAYISTCITAFIGHIYRPGLLLCVGWVKIGRNWLVHVRSNIHQMCEWQKIDPVQGPDLQRRLPAHF